MRASGLKVHILLTILLLLGTTTLLASLVISMFWQQSLIRTEANRVHSALSIATQALHTNIPRGNIETIAFLNNVRKTTSVDCLVSVSFTGANSPFTSGNCQDKQHLTTLMNKSVQTDSPIVEPYGSTWGIFSPSPESLIIALPYGLDKSQGSMLAVLSLKPVYDQIRQKQKIIIVYLLVNILFIAIIGFFRLVKSTVKPLERLVRITEEYDEQNEFILIPGREGGEFGQLSTALNRMIQRIDKDRRNLRDTVISLEEANIKLQQTQEEMVRTEKLASIGRLSAGLAHEIGNPIGIIQGYLELLQRKTLTEKDRHQFTQRAVTELNRINHLIRQLLDFARSSPSAQQQVRINALLKDMLDLFKARRKMEHIHFQLTLQTENDLVVTSEEGLRQILLNCLLNAVDAIEEMSDDHRGEVTISSYDETDPAGKHCIAISIRDNGCGIDATHLANIFDPFFTTKDPGKGTGLGLSVSHTIIETLGGNISVQSAPEKGTEIKIILPRPG